MVVSTKIFLEKKSEEEEPTVGAPGIVATSAVGMVIGFKSGVLGIGGGALSVPFLLYCGLPMKKASGTSASFTLPIAIVGTLSFLLLSGTQTDIPWSTGYVYWPAVLLVAPFTILGAPVGAKFAGIVAPEKLRTIFAGLLLVISMRMLSGTGLIAWDFPLI
ncbi:sulfite exporter TauE/SafE family protein [Acaryochloris sp. 'Moss Beach']|uniref:sulfite exporter TauE/SafE family protein n=1 Tax=Acaryochloris sp. 'Moss Beach' TaxID=2740837 RepID=UPI002102AB58|nr:sulfite exporter TauE/SafE family protein [Acaryochloris sp. 'Moss Beach']